MEMAYTELNAKLCAFLDKTPNSFFAVKNIKEELAAAGFAELQETADGSCRQAANIMSAVTVRRCWPL